MLFYCAMASSRMICCDVIEFLEEEGNWMSMLLILPATSLL